MKKLKKIPKFQDEQSENRFWNHNDSTQYIDWKNAKKIKFNNLKPSTKTISLRLPVNLLEKIKLEANKRDVPYQSFMKMLLAERLGI